MVSSLKDERIFDATEDKFGNYLMVGRKMATGTYNSSAYYLFLNNNGNFLAEQEFINEDTSSFFAKIHAINDSIFIFGTKGLTSTGIKNELWLIILDQNFNQIKNKSFIIKDHNIVDIEMHTTSKGNFLICGTSDSDSSDFDIFFFEISHSGDSIKFNVAPLSMNQIEFDFLENQDGGFKVFSWGLFPNVEPYNGYIAKFDSNYNYLSADSLPYGLKNNNSAKCLNGNSYFVTGKKLITNPTKNDMGIAKLTMDDQIIKANHFGKTSDTSHHVGACSNLDFISSDNIYFGGTANIIENHLIYQPENSWIMLNNLDSNLNLNWQKFYGGDAFYYLWGLRATTDGGCLLSCTRYDETIQNEELDIIILKIDSNGLLTSTNDDFSIPVNRLAIAPNPATNYVSIRYPDIFGKNEKKIVIYNARGSAVLTVDATWEASEINLNISNLPAGLYLVELIIDGKRTGTGKMIKI